MKKHYRHETDCLNCGATLQGHFCHVCGQENLEIKESFGHMMNHAVSDYFHFDHQFFHTLKPLLFKPGMLTTEYMAGRRMQYLHPIKMYIFISVVYFLLLFQSGHNLVNFNEENAKPVKSEKLLGSVKKDTGLIAASQKAPKGKLKFGPLTFSNADALKSQKKEEASLKATTGDSSLAQYHANQNKLPASERHGFFKRLLNEKILTYHEKYGARASEVFLEDFKHNVPKMMFILLPLFALILRVTFRYSKKFYVEHLIYSFHLHCFVFLVLAFNFLLEKIITPGSALDQVIGFVSGVYILWYIYKSLRVVYQRSRLRTITKMIGMDLMYTLSFIACIMLVLFVTTLSAG